jgi:hypothetical protein
MQYLVRRKIMIDYNVQGMNKNIVEANIKLQDENKWLKEDIEKLKARIQRAIDYINEEFVFNDGTLGEADIKLVDILKGRYVEKEKE